MAAAPLKTSQLRILQKVMSPPGMSTLHGYCAGAAAAQPVCFTSS